ncbi:2OG-Fe(II) oxygenase [Streptomyces griseus]|uniref:2OG-Fe(II) oxygenase n=1 Tax=Streptomyces griseus TaxID=1911 RepID=UPI0033C22F28
MGTGSDQPRHECQFAVHGSGDFCRPHTDADPQLPEQRTTTCVFYLHHPRPFTGGNLRIHDTIVFFPPTALHEVTTVTSPTNGPTNARCSITG